MIQTEVGFWPYSNAPASVLIYFRHTRITRMVETVGEDTHVITVAIVSYAFYGGTFKTDAFIASEGAESLRLAEYQKCDMNEENKVDIERFIRKDALPNVYAGDEPPEAVMDDRHNSICHAISAAVDEGLIQRPPPPARPDQSSYAW